MKNHLFDWLDNVEGKPEGTTTHNITQELKRQGYNTNTNKKRDCQTFKCYNETNSPTQPFCFDCLRRKAEDKAKTIIY
jgi:hypothetical protein